jgi:hypothetical protein
MHYTILNYLGASCVIGNREKVEKGTYGISETANILEASFRIIG